jgi:hypothetical protein
VLHDNLANGLRRLELPGDRHEGKPPTADLAARISWPV